MSYGNDGNHTEGHDLPTQRDRDNAVWLYQHTQLPEGVIGERFGVTRQTVHSWVQAAGVPLRGPVPHRSDVEDEIVLSDVDAEQALPTAVAVVLRALAEQSAALGRIEGSLNALVQLLGQGTFVTSLPSRSQE